MGPAGRQLPTFRSLTGDWELPPLRSHPCLSAVTTGCRSVRQPPAQIALVDLASFLCNQWVATRRWGDASGGAAAGRPRRMLVDRTRETGDGFCVPNDSQAETHLLLDSGGRHEASNADQLAEAILLRRSRLLLLRVGGRTIGGPGRGTKDRYTDGDAQFRLHVGRGGRAGATHGCRAVRVWRLVGRA